MSNIPIKKGPSRFVVILAAATLINCARADTAFTFDLSGNLESQTSASTLPPQIFASPQPQIVQPGELASFSVVVADTRGLAYQWCFNGTNLSGATGDALLLTNVNALNEGPYTVVLVNGSGSITSAPAMLWIDADRDGLPDSWEQTYFGGLAQNPTGDFDHDGISNLDEFSDGTNPTNSTSAQFRLAVLSDGGSVTVTPSKLSYTNGEVVTLTATAFAPDIFHGWTGDASGTNNPLTLVMSTNKTVFARFQPMTLTWTNAAGGSWHTASNWNLNFVPLSMDDVVLPLNVTVTMNSSAVCRAFTLSSGALTGAGDLTINGTATWTGGTLSGSGRTIVAPGATFTINCSSPLTVTRPLENGGTVVWTNIFGLSVGGVITNRPGALFDVRNTATLSSAGGSPRFDNAGTFRKSVSSGTTIFGFPFNNYGTVDLQTGNIVHSSSFVNNGAVALAAGTIFQMAGGGSGNGTFTNPATALVEWVNFTAFTLNPGAQLNGAGLYRNSGSTVSCDADLAVQNLEQTAGSSFGTFAGSGMLTISNTMNWLSGTLSGSGKTIVAPGATFNINGSGSTLTLSRPLDNGGTTVWTNILGLSLGAVITNRPGALFDVRNAVTLNSAGGSPRFDNAGTFRKSVNSGVTFFNIPFTNYADVDLQTGTLQHGVAVANSGSVVLAAGTTYRLAGGGSSSGTFTNPATALVEWINFTTFTLNPGAQLNGAGLYRNAGATVSCDADLAVQNLEQTAGSSFGTFAGSGTLTISNTMNWFSGTLSGSGKTIVVPGARLNIISSGSTLTLSRPLDNGGTTVWTNILGLSVGAVITNRPGALFDVQNTATLSSAGGSPRFDNAGTFRKSLNSGATFFNIPFTNYADVDLQTGTLQHGVAVANSGSVVLAAGTTYRLAGGGSSSGTFTNPATSLVEWTTSGFTLNPGAQLNGAGLYRVNGAAAINFVTDLAVQNLDVIGDLFTTAVTGTGTLTVSNAMAWVSGPMGGSGRTIIAPGATLTINPSTSPNLSRTLENGGTVIYTGAFGMSVNSVVITNRAGALFNVQNATTISSGGTARFDNTGTFRKSVSSGTSALGFPFTNYGTVDIQTGTLNHNGSFVNNGAVALAAGTVDRIISGGSGNGTFTNPATALVEWTGSSFTLNPGAQLNGAGLYRVNGATAVNLATDLAVQNLDVIGDLFTTAVTGAGTLTVSNAMTWYSGPMGGSGRTIIAPGATLTINPTTSPNLTRTLENGGTVIYTGIFGMSVNSVVITNRAGALFDVQNATTISGGGTARFDNAGTFRKSVSSSTSALGFPFTNYGTVDIRTGILALSGNFVSTTDSRLNCALGGTTAGTGYGQLQKSGNLSLDGTLSVDLLPGFVPPTNSTYTVVSAGARSGTFSSFSYPANRVSLQLSNTATAVILTVTNVLPVPAPVLLPPEIAGASATLKWTATSNVAYQLEYNTAVSPSNWTALGSTVTTPGNLASQLDTLTSSNRFYRVRVLP